MLSSAIDLQPLEVEVRVYEGGRVIIDEVCSISIRSITRSGYLRLTGTTSRTAVTVED